MKGRGVEENKIRNIDIKFIKAISDIGEGIMNLDDVIEIIERLVSSGYVDRMWLTKFEKLVRDLDEVKERLEDFWEDFWKFGLKL